MLSVPAGHRYCLAVHSGRVSVRPDPTEPWWPHPALEIDRVRSVADTVDLVHLHFGFEHRTVDQLQAWVHELRRLGLMLVFTVHDLANPNIDDQQLHLDQLDVLVPAADELITLTPGAATEIARRWGRRPHVIPHPPVVLDRPLGVDTEPGLVGVHFKRVRPGTMPVADAAPLLVEAARAVDARLLLSIDGRAEPTEIAELRRWSRTKGVEVAVDEHRPDDEFAVALARLAVAVLPYRFGTHSGWLEACRDVGTRVVAPDCGPYADQWADVETFRCVERTWDADSLTTAMARAVSRTLPDAPTADAQRTRLREIVRRHDAVFAATRGAA